MECTYKHPCIENAGLLKNAYEANPNCPVSGHSDYVCSAAWSPDGTKLASGSNDKTVKIWNPATGECLWMVRGHSEDNPECICFGDDEDSDSDEERPFPRPECPVRGHSDCARCVAFKPDNPKILVSASSDETIKTWDITSGS